MRSGTWIGDWLRTWRALGPKATDADGRALATMLGIERVGGESIAVALPKIEARLDVQLDDVVATGTAVQIAHHDTAASVPAVGHGGGSDLVLTGPAIDPRSAPTWRVEGVLERESRRLPDHPLDPLFERKVTRAVLGAMVAERRPEGEVLVREAVQLLARRVTITRLPRRLIATVRGGLAVVVVRARMDPFAQDLTELIERLRQVIGREAVREFSHDARGLVSVGARHTWPPAPGVPVLIVSAAAEVPVEVPRGSTVTLLVPGRPARPPELAPDVALVCWDRRTRVREVGRARRAVGRR